MTPESFAAALFTLLGFLIGVVVARHLTTAPAITVACQHAAFATVEDMRQVHSDLIDCRRDLDEIRP